MRWSWGRVCIERPTRHSLRNFGDFFTANHLTDTDKQNSTAKIHNLNTTRKSKQRKIE